MSSIPEKRPILELQLLNSEPLFFCESTKLNRAQSSPFKYACLKHSEKGIMTQIFYAAGGYLSWLESLVYTQDVGGSSPSPPTTISQQKLCPSPVASNELSLEHNGQNRYY